MDGGLITTTGAGTYFNQLGGYIGDIDNSAGNNYGGIGMQSALRSLYEEYRIDAIKFTFVPLATQSSQGGATAGQVAYAINRAPWSTLPTAMLDILRQNDCKVFNTTRGFSVTVRKPAWGQVSPLTSDLAPSPPTNLKNFTSTTSHAWCSTRDSSIANIPQPYWYGVDLAITGFTGGITCYHVYRTYYITFRNQN